MHPPRPPSPVPPDRHMDPRTHPAGHPLRDWTTPQRGRMNGTGPDTFPLRLKGTQLPSPAGHTTPCTPAPSTALTPRQLRRKQQFPNSSYVQRQTHMCKKTHAGVKHKTPHLTNSAGTVPGFKCGPVTQSHRATSCNSAPQHWTLSVWLSVPIARESPAGPLAAAPTNSGDQERFTLPHNTGGDTQAPGLTATTLPRRRGGSGSPARPAHPAHPNSRALGGPPLPPPPCLAPTPSPSQRLAAPARAHTRPAPPQRAPQGEGDTGLQN